MATTKQSAATIDMIKEMYLVGASYRQIGAATKCGMGTIANVVKAAGLPPRGKKRPTLVTEAQLMALAEGEVKPKPVEPDLSYLDHTTTVAAPKAKAKPAPKAKAKAPAKKRPAPKAKRAVKRATKRTTKRTVKHPTLKVGTVISKLDRHGKVRARCTVVKDGIKYAGKVYGSPSSAAMAAMKKLGLESKAVNGYVWWGIGK